MLDSRIVKVKVKVILPVSTRPDLKVERMTYPCMTPSAARRYSRLDFVEARIPVVCAKNNCSHSHSFSTIKRNEINSKQGRNPIIN